MPSRKQRRNSKKLYWFALKLVCDEFLIFGGSKRKVYHFHDIYHHHHHLAFYALAFIPTYTRTAAAVARGEATYYHQDLKVNNQSFG